MGRNLAGLLVVLVIAVGGFFFRDRLESSADDLRLGDCFDIPAGEQVVEEVQHHPCNESHTGEIIGLSDYPGDGKAEYPGESKLFAFADDLCMRAFRNYTGKDPINDPVFTWGYFYPIREGWDEGDHEVACYLLRVDEAPMTNSFRVAGG